MLKKNSEIIPCLIFAILALFIYLNLCFGHAPHQILSSLVVNLTQNYYKPNYNFFTVPIIGRINIHLFFYVFIIFYVLGVCFLRLFLKISGNSKHKVSSRSELNITAGVFVFLAVFQLICQAQHFVKATNKFGDKNLKQKLDIIYDVESYRFVKYSLKHLSGRSKGELIMGPNSRETMDRYLIMYYLYPFLDMRGEKDNRKWLAVFNKKDPFAVIPEDYYVVGNYNPRSLLAVKKNK